MRNTPPHSTPCYTIPLPPSASSCGGTSRQGDRQGEVGMRLDIHPINCGRCLSSSPSLYPFFNRYPLCPVCPDSSLSCSLCPLSYIVPLSCHEWVCPYVINSHPHLWVKAK